MNARFAYDYRSTHRRLPAKKRNHTNDSALILCPTNTGRKTRMDSGFKPRPRESAQESHPNVNVSVDSLAVPPQVFCSQPCEAISQDLELPVQITASPAQSSPGVRSLEEELQEAIQRAQVSGDDTAAHGVTRDEPDDDVNQVFSPSHPQ